MVILASESYGKFITSVWLTLQILALCIRRFTKHISVGLGVLFCIFSCRKDKFCFTNTNSTRDEQILWIINYKNKTVEYLRIF